MANRKVADVVAAIPFNDGTNRKRYLTVGSLIQLAENDASKGPGYIIALDPTFNPAGVPTHGGSVMLSCYNPKPPRQSSTPPAEPTRTHHSPRPVEFDEGDIPF